MRMNTMVGTPYYIAPEILRGHGYTQAVDMWSMGVITYMLLSGKPPFAAREDSAILAKVRKGKYNFSGETWKAVSADAHDFVQRLLEANPKKRMNAESALQHRWLRRNDDYAAHKPPSGRLLDPGIVHSLRDFSRMSVIKRAALEAIAFSMNAREIVDMRRAFQTIDKDKSGQLTLSEVQEALIMEGMSAEEVRKVFDGVNQDAQRTISYSEFLAATLSRRLYMQEERIQEAFHRLDVSNTGYITKEDLRAVLGDDYDPVRVDEMMSAADDSGDGKIDYGEFVKMIRDERALMVDAVKPAPSASRAELDSECVARTPLCVFAPSIVADSCAVAAALTVASRSTRRKTTTTRTAMRTTAALAARLAVRAALGGPMPAAATRRSSTCPFLQSCWRRPTRRRRAARARVTRRAALPSLLPPTPLSLPSTAMPAARPRARLTATRAARLPTRRRAMPTLTATTRRRSSADLCPACYAGAAVQRFPFTTNHLSRTLVRCCCASASPRPEKPREQTTRAPARLPWPGAPAQPARDVRIVIIVRKSSTGLHITRVTMARVVGPLVLLALCMLLPQVDGDSAAISAPPTTTARVIEGDDGLLHIGTAAAGAGWGEREPAGRHRVEEAARVAPPQEGAPRDITAADRGERQSPQPLAHSGGVVAARRRGQGDLVYLPVQLTWRGADPGETTLTHTNTTMVVVATVDMLSYEDEIVRARTPRTGCAPAAAARHVRCCNVHDARRAGGRRAAGLRHYRGAGRPR